MSKTISMLPRFLMCLWIPLLLLIACRQEEPRIPVALVTLDVEIPGPTDIAVNSRNGYVYIINNANQVGVIQGVEAVALLETDSPRSVNNFAMAIDEERGWVYVVNKYSDSVAVIRDTEVVAIIKAAGREPQDVAIDPDSGWAYVVSPYSYYPRPPEEIITEGNVMVLSGTEVIDTIPLGEVRTTHVTVDPVNSYVYVGSVRGTVIVLKDMEEIARYETGSSVIAMDTNLHTGDVYMVNGNQKLYHFKEGQLVDESQLTEGNASVRNMQVHPTTGDVYLINWGEQTEAIVVRRSKIIGRVPISGGFKMDIDPISGNVYVADFWSDLLTVIHGTEVIATFETGQYPYGIGVNPANGQVYISNTNEGTITVLGLPE